MPESITATFTGARSGWSGQYVHALSCSRYHCFAASGSGLSNASATARDDERRDGDDEARCAFHCTTIGVETPGARPWPGAQRTR